LKSRDHWFLLAARPGYESEVHDYGGDQATATAAYNVREAPCSVVDY